MFGFLHERGTLFERLERHFAGIRRETFKNPGLEIGRTSIEAHESRLGETHRYEP